MSLADFGSGCDQVGRKAENARGKIEQLRQEAEKKWWGNLNAELDKVGSAVREVGDAMVEFVRLDQTNWTPALQGTVVQLYEIQKTVKETQAVSTDILDAIEKLIESKVPSFRLWLSKMVEDAHTGQLSLDDLLKNIDKMMISDGVAQLNSMFRNDVPGFILEFRKLVTLIKEGGDAAGTAAGGGGA